MTQRTDRRQFIQFSALAGSSLLVPSCAGVVRTYSRNEKLNVAVIGAGGKGNRDARGVAGENLVALCDVDEKQGAKTFKQYPNAKRYRDYRVMLDKENLDAVVISTPDHSHAPAAVRAIQQGLHVYCQKPLTHTVHEARVLRDLARKHGVSTSMGNQGSAFSKAREAAEVIQSGAIGEIREVHVWTDRPGVGKRQWWPQGMERDNTIEKIPATLRWDLWLGPAPYRPYRSGLAPFAWRGVWDYGTGALGDMGCHVMNMPFNALQLGAPTAVSADAPGGTNESPPKRSKVTYEFPQRGALPPCKLTWYDGGNLPSTEIIPGFGKRKLSTNGSILVGSKGVIYSAGAYGERYDMYPKDKFEGYKPPAPTLQRARGAEGDKIYNEWIDDCKGGPTCLATFDYACALTETVLLGNLAIRAGERVEWDSAALRSPNSPKANRYVSKEYSYGFGID